MPGALGVARELRRALAHLRDRAGRRLQRLGPQRLDRIDDRDPRLARPRARRAMRSSWVSASEAHALQFEPEPPRAQRDLLGRFFAA